MPLQTLHTCDFSERFLSSLSCSGLPMQRTRTWRTSDESCIVTRNSTVNCQWVRPTQWIRACKWVYVWVVGGWQDVVMRWGWGAVMGRLLRSLYGSWAEAAGCSRPYNEMCNETKLESEVGWAQAVGISGGGCTPASRLAKMQPWMLSAARALEATARC